MRQYAIAERVRHRSGGPVLLVLKYWPPYSEKWWDSLSTCRRPPNDVYECVWFNGIGERQHGFFAYEELEPA